MQKLVEREQAPEGVGRVDKGNPDLFEQPHVHLQSGAASNKDGTWKVETLPYLTERNLKTRMWPTEQYVFPLRPIDFMKDAPDIYVYYNVTRSKDGINNDWEYGRTIVAECYPLAHPTIP